MNVSTMRRVDRWLGVPACFVLTLHRRIAGLLGRRPAPRVRSILFVKLAEQGSTVLAHPALSRAIEMVGRENVYFLAFEENRFILDVMEIIPGANVVAIPTRGMLSVLTGALRAIRRLRRARVDAAVDLEFFARSSAVLSYLSGATWRAGFHPFPGEAGYRGDLMTHRVHFNTHLHTVQTFQTLVEALNHPPALFPAFDLPAPPKEAPLPRFQPAPQEVEEVKAMLRQETGREGIPPLILLNANASDLLPLRRWPSERYVELASRLLEKYPALYVAFTGAPGEAPIAARLVRQVGSERCFSLAGKTTLRQLLVLYTLAEVLATNDSGPAHFAALTPIDVVTLFGPETPALFAALTPRNHVLWSGIVCSPCVNAFNNRESQCKNNICMQRITVDQVFAEVRRAYDARRGET